MKVKLSEYQLREIKDAGVRIALFTLSSVVFLNLVLASAYFWGLLK